MSEKRVQSPPAGPWVLITGGSGGIGRELGRLFAGDGYRLLLVSENEAELDDARRHFAGGFPATEVRTFCQDLSRPEGADAVYAFTREHGLTIDVLVNNAGFGTYGFIDDIDMEREAAMLNLHVVSLYRLTRLFLRDMIARDRGHILNLSSISAFQPNPMLATYGASKGFVLQFSRAVHHELRERGVNVGVTAVCPTATRGTGFQARAGMERTNTFDSWMTSTPQRVARDAFRGMRQKKEVVIPGRGLGLLHSLVRRLPDAVLIRMARGQLRVKS